MLYTVMVKALLHIRHCLSSLLSSQLLPTFALPVCSDNSKPASAVSQIQLWAMACTSGQHTSTCFSFEPSAMPHPVPQLFQEELLCDLCTGALTAQLAALESSLHAAVLNLTDLTDQATGSGDGRHALTMVALRLQQPQV